MIWEKKFILTASRMKYFKYILGRIKKLSGLTTERAQLLTNSSVVEHGGQDEQDVVGPVLPVVRHLKLFDHKDVQMSCALRGMENVEQAVFLASCGRGEDWTLEKVGVLQTDKHG